ncbi:MAG: hypothetical protein QX198_05835 [Methylococcaceae bacterium]
MTDDRRSHETSSLRKFFDDHLHLLQNHISSLNSHLQDAQQQADEDRQIVEKFVAASNSKMRAVHGYSDKLRDHVRALYSHVLQIAEQIPPPIDLTLDVFVTDPLINALFVNNIDIDKLFESDPEVHAYLRSDNHHQDTVLYALLTASKSEHRTLGIGMLGEMLIRELPQQVVNFSSHKIHAPCASNAELSSALRKYLFDRVVAMINQEMTARMTSQAFTASKETYESRVKSLANPTVYLGALIEYLEIPEQLLSIAKIHFRLSKLGIKLNDNDKQSANEFDIHELTWSDNTKDVALQIARAR